MGLQSCEFLSQETYLRKCPFFSPSELRDQGWAGREVRWGFGDTCPTASQIQVSSLTNSFLRTFAREIKVLSRAALEKSMEGKQNAVTKHGGEEGCLLPWKTFLVYDTVGKHFL